MAEQRRTAMDVADEAHERIERLNRWTAVLHRRLWAIETHLGLDPHPRLELTDDAFHNNLLPEDSAAR